MINYRYPNQELILVKAAKLDYERYMKRSNVSAVEASHLFIEVLPKIDSIFAFLNPHLQEAQEIFKLLDDAAKNGKINNIQNENGPYKAPLRDWGHFLIRIKHPIPDILLKLIKKSIKEQTNNYLNEPTPAPLMQSEQKHEKLRDTLNHLDEHFPKIPYKYYFHHPEITKLIKDEKYTEKTFELLASKLIARVRSGGRPTKDMLDDYKKAHPGRKMQEWFAKIKPLKE